MLVLSRKVGEKIWIGEDIAITVVKISNNGVRLGIDAPHELAIVREELKKRIEEMNPETTVVNSEAVKESEP